MEGKDDKVDRVDNLKRKKVDDRVRIMVENGVRTKHRTFFVVIGDKGRDHIPNLHYMLKKAGKGSVSVLWTYKTELAFKSSNARKRHRLEKSERKFDKISESYEIWLDQTDIRYCYYKDTYKVLGNTFGMLIIQDFETLTPNLLARTVETVEGGGIVLMLINKMSSLKALYTMTMDIHSRYRTSKYQDIIPRFNERFLLSFSDLHTFIAVDDELNVVPFTSSMQAIEPVDVTKHDGYRTQAELELKSIQSTLKDNPIIGPLVNIAKTADQAKLVMDLMAIVVEKERSLRTTAIVTAGRGRGKSAALGVAVAGAIGQGFSNIFVTSPAPENLKTFFFFVAKTLDEMGYVEKDDYEVHQSTNPAFNKAVVRLNIYKEHRQTIQYISAQDSSQYAQAEMLVIDEAAAIPLPLLEKMFGPYLILMASTINGYEGTGRSLSMKLLQRLKAEAQNTAGMAPQVVEADKKANPRNVSASMKVGGGREFKQMNLDEPIRYAPGDPVEKWLNKVLCMDPALAQSRKKTPLMPHPDMCQLYYVNRDTLFSYHTAAEDLLQRMMALYVSSHYKNQPNDLQLISDAPAHHLFVLLPPVNASTSKIPEPLAVIQACEEGGISSNQVSSDLGKGSRPSGDLVPYTIAQQFQENSFASISGLRIIRIAVAPEYQRMKYGTRALSLLLQYYNGEIIYEEEDSAFGAMDEDESPSNLPAGSEVLSKKHKLPNLLQPLSQRRIHEHVAYICTSFGATLPLFEFWNKSGFSPVYMRQGENDLTGEHTMIMLKPLDKLPEFKTEWVSKLHADFHKRLLGLLGSAFRDMPLDLALSTVLHCPGKTNALLQTNQNVPRKKMPDGRWSIDGIPQLSYQDLEPLGITIYDSKRLGAFNRMVVDIQTISDLIPIFAKLYFGKRIILLPDGTQGVALSVTQAALLLALGLQHRTIEDISGSQLKIGTTQANALIYQAMSKIAEFLSAVIKSAPSTDEPKDTATAAAGEGKPTKGSEHESKGVKKDGGKKKKRVG